MYLFRGKRVDNGKWIEGYYCKATKHWHKYGIHNDWIITSAFQNGGFFNLAGRYAVVSETVGQWTGLTDKNGVKIFEGDIVVPVWVSPSGKIDGLNEDIKGTVIYKAGSYYVKPRYEREYLIGGFIRKKFIEYRSNVGEIYDYENNVFLGEVIGNIYENNLEE